MTNTSNPTGPNKPRKRLPRWAQIAAVCVGIAGAATLTYVRSDGGSDAVEQVGLVELLDRIDAGDVEAATINDDARTVTVTLDDGTELAASYPFLGGNEVVGALRDAGVVDTTVEAPVQPSAFTNVMLAMLPIIVIIGFLAFIMRRTTSGIFKFANKSIVADIPNVRFSDVIGVPEAVDDLSEVVEVLRNPDNYKAAGAKVPKGALLVGPPGVGKTLLAKAVAAEAGCAFFAVTGSDFVEMFVGVGAKRVRDLFGAARKAGTAVIFIDEIDAIGRSRTSGPSNGATDERENTLNAILTEMDGFKGGNIVVLAATNRPELLDKALVRAGRFDRQVSVPLPDRGGRTALFAFYLNDAERVDGFDVERASDILARRSTGLSGADIANVVNEAKLIVAKRGNTKIGLDDVEAALERVAMGRERRSTVMTDLERRIVAYHEAGHTVCALMQDHTADPMSVSIVPRGAAGGVTWLDPGDQEHFKTRTEMLAHLVVAMGGRAAEKKILDGDYTQGASGDISAATSHATQMVCAYGMSELGNVAIDPERLTGEDAAAVRSVVRTMIDNAALDADLLVAEHWGLLDAIAVALLERETLSRDDLHAIIAELNKPAGDDEPLAAVAA